MPNDENTLREDIFAAFIKDGSSEADARAKTDAALVAATAVITPVSLSAASGEVLKKSRPQWTDHTDGDVEAHLRHAYAGEIKTDTLTTGIILNDDKTFYGKVKNWLRTHKLPPDINLRETRAELQASDAKKLEQTGGTFTLSQLFTLLRKIGNEEIRDALRLYETNRSRIKKAIKPANAAKPKADKRAP